MIHQCHRRTEGELKSDDTRGKPVRQVNAAEKRTASELENVWILFFSRTGLSITPKVRLQVIGVMYGALFQRTTGMYSLLKYGAH